jgi:hypothetical protein
VVIVVCWAALAYITLELLKRAYLSIRDKVPWSCSHTEPQGSALWSYLACSRLWRPPEGSALSGAW